MRSLVTPRVNIGLGPIPPCRQDGIVNGEMVKEDLDRLGHNYK